MLILLQRGVGGEKRSFQKIDTLYQTAIGPRLAFKDSSVVQLKFPALVPEMC